MQLLIVLMSRYWVTIKESRLQKFNKIFVIFVRRFLSFTIIRWVITNKITFNHRIKKVIIIRKMLLCIVLYVSYCINDISFATSRNWNSSTMVCIHVYQSHNMAKSLIILCYHISSVANCKRVFFYMLKTWKWFYTKT